MILVHDMKDLRRDYNAKVLDTMITEFMKLEKPIEDLQCQVERLHRMGHPSEP